MAHYFAVAFEFMFGFSLTFVFSLLFVLQAEEGADKEDVSTFIKKNYDNKNNFVKIRG